MSADFDFRAVGGIPEPVPAFLTSAASEPVWNFGWRAGQHDAVQNVLATLPVKYFCDAAPHLRGSGEDKTVLLSDLAKKLLGKHMPAQQQPRGTCVSRGYSRAVDYLELVQIAVRGKAEEFKFASHAYIYGCGAEVGHDQNYQDGLVGAWAAKAVNTFGVCTNEQCADKDVGYDDLAVQWKAKGVPQKFKDLGKNNLVKSIALVRTPEEARDALVNGKPVSVCSGQGFSMTRDSEGYCRAQGSWSHCMMWSGYRSDKKRFLVEQSWGQNTPSGPIGDLDIPDNAFWIDWSVGARMLSGEDSFALDAFDGWPALQIDWTKL